MVIAAVNPIGQSTRIAFAHGNRVSFLVRDDCLGVVYRMFPLTTAPSGRITVKEACIGQIGAGITHAPLDCLANAVMALAADLPTDGGG